VRIGGKAWEKTFHQSLGQRSPRPVRRQRAAPRVA
jgi:hypothetical protein